MRITLDVDNKTITILDEVNLEKLYKFLKEHVDNWKEYDLKQETKYVDRWNWYPYNGPYWVTNPTIYYDSTTTTGIGETISTGTYTVDFS